MNYDVRVNALIVGCGSVTQSMIPALKANPWFQAVGLVDVRDDALGRTGTTLGVPAEGQYKDLSVALVQTGADTAIINTPSDGHSGQCLAALRAGLHVLVAKPITNERSLG